MKRVFFITTLAAAAAVWPAASAAGTFSGVVVAKQHGSLLVASPSGLVRAIAGHASVGSRIELSGGGLIIVGRAHTTRIRGIVIRRVGSTMFLSSNKHLIAVHTGRRLAAAVDTPPAPPTTPAAGTGTVVSTQVAIGSNGQLDEQSEDDLGAASSNSLQVQAVVSAVGPGSVTLTVAGQSLTVQLPGGLTLPASFVGQAVTINLSLSDQGGTGANGDNSDDNGNNNNDDGDGGSGGGGGD
jgi:hypothetical protein